MSKGRTFGDLRKYRGGKDLEGWDFEQRKKLKPKPPEAPPGEQGRIPGTEALSYRPGHEPQRKNKRGR